MDEEPWVPELPPEKNSHHDDLPPRCPECRAILRRAGLDEYRCTEHGIVRPYYGEGNGNPEILDT